MTTIPMLEKELEQAYKDIKYYKNRIERLNNQLQQKENIIKKVREYIKTHWAMTEQEQVYLYELEDRKELLEILDKKEVN